MDGQECGDNLDYAFFMSYFVICCKLNIFALFYYTNALLH